MDATNADGLLVSIRYDAVDEEMKKDLVKLLD